MKGGDVRIANDRLCFIFFSFAFLFLFVVFSILRFNIRISIITQVTVTYHHKSVTVTLSHDHMSQGKTVKDSRRNNIIYKLCIHKRTQQGTTTVFYLLFI